MTTITHFPHVEASQIGTKAIASNIMGNIQDSHLQVPHSGQAPPDSFTSFFGILFLPLSNALSVI